MRDNIIFFAKKAPEMALSVFLMGFGIACMLHSNIGSDPVTVFMDGIAKILGVSSGAGVAVYNGLMILFTLLFNRKMFGAGTIVALFMGVFVNASSALLGLLIGENATPLPQVLLNVIGAVSLGASIGLYLNLDFGCTPTDGGVLWISRALSLQYKHSLWIFYGISCILGVIMGGVAGIGTAISFFIVGAVSEKVIKPRGVLR